MSFFRIPESLMAPRTASRTKSLMVLSGNFPNRVIPIPMTATSRTETLLSGLVLLFEELGLLRCALQRIRLEPRDRGADMEDPVHLLHDLLLEPGDIRFRNGLASLHLELEGRHDPGRLLRQDDAERPREPRNETIDHPLDGCRVDR